MNVWQRASEVVKQCLQEGVCEFVVCAGARNAALIEVLSRVEQAGHIRVWRHFEERSAGFFALGRTQETAHPCAVVTTSGTAVAELLPAMIEAHYQSRPLIAITADRPEAFRFSGAPQAINQVGIFGDYVSHVDIADWGGHGPLHWNVELDESLELGEERFEDMLVGDFKPAKQRIDVAALARWLRKDMISGIVVMVGGLEPEEREEVFHFCADFKAPVVVDATSGMREALQGLLLVDAERILKDKPPKKVLRLGDVPTSRFWRDLEDMEQVSVWSVCRSGLPGLARPSEVCRGPVHRVLAALGDVDSVDDVRDHLVGNSSRASRIDELLECYPDSEPAMVRTVSQFASIGSSVFLGNSLPIREWNQFAQWARPVTQIRANRGANGIDGQISTWLGSTADLEDAWAVIGDLTALYDVAAGFLLEQTENKGRVLVVINNQGGKIFERLPRLGAMHERAVECMTNPHQADLSGMAMLWGMEHVRVNRVDDFDQFESGEKAVLLELVPDADQTSQVWAGLS